MKLKTKETNSTVSVSFSTPQGKNVIALFNKTGKIGGHMKIPDNTGRILVNEALTSHIQPQSGF